MLHIERRHNAFGCKDARIVSRETIEQTRLSATSDHNSCELIGSNLVEEFLCSWHFRRRGEGVENLALALIHAFHFLWIGVTSELSLRKHIECGESRAPFVHVDFLFFDVEAKFATHLCPRFCVCGHGVEKHPIHVEEGGAEREEGRASLSSSGRAVYTRSEQW